MKLALRLSSTIAVTLFALAGQIAAPQDFHLTIGKQEVLDSKILGEKRTILVATPPQMKPNLPLLVVLDGEWTFTKVAVIVDHLALSSQQIELLRGVVGIDQRKHDAMKGKIPSRVPRIFPFVRH